MEHSWSSGSILFVWKSTVTNQYNILTLPFSLDIEAKDLRNAVSDVPGIYLRSESQTLNTSSQKT